MSDPRRPTEPLIAHPDRERLVAFDKYDWKEFVLRIASFIC